MSSFIYTVLTSIHRWNLLKMFSPNSQIPCFIGLFFIKSKPACNNLQLLPRQRSCQQYTINTNDGFMLSEIHMYMRFMVLSDVSKQHINNHAAKPT